MAGGETSVGWFYGFELHLAVHDRGVLLAFRLTPGNVDDRRPVSRLVRRLFGKHCADRGYISQALSERACRAGRVPHHQAPLEHGQPRRLLAVVDKPLLHKRVIVETVVDQLKNARTAARSSTPAIAACSTSWST